ncbi:MAG: hypothetical protein C0427_02085 [Rhodobacter sp.]|nr:hypothetical protein [Rhodobacter sp.]
MKAIAEYFRDLAAGDRYFGAEPPTPDAAMLHQIAEREIQRRVEAKIQDNGVVLRASDQPEAAPVAAVAPQLAAPVEAEAPVAAAVAAEAPVAAVVSEPSVAVPPSVAPASVPATESVVEKLSRLRSEIAAHPATMAPAQTAPVVSFAIPDYLEDQDADTLDAAALADFLPEDAVSDIAPDLPEDVAELAPIEELRSEAPMRAEEVAEAVVEQAPFEEEPADLVADLPEIDFSAVMAEADVAEAEATDAEVAEPDAIEDLAQMDGVDLASVMEEVAETPLAETVHQDDLAVSEAEATEPGDDLPESLMAALADTAEPIAEAVAEMPATQDDDYEAEADIWSETVADAMTDAGEDSLLASLAAEANAAPEAAPEVETTAEAEAIWAETWAETTEPVAEADVTEAADAAAAAPVEDAEAEELRAAMTEDTGETTAVAVAEETPGGMELRPGSAEKLQRARARVIRIRKSDEAVTPAVAEQPQAVAEDAQTAEAAVSTAAFAEVEERALTASTPLLSAEDEAELQRELAALRRGEAEQDADLMDSMSHLAQQPDSRRSFDGPSADEALNRLMKQTDNEMEGSETKRRQSAIQHLKAAVAATVADRKVTGEKAGETETVSRLARYRNDLAMAVKAALPGGRGTTAGERPAPLVLVSEQRIDRPRPTSTPSASAAPSPIRPRRVTSAGFGMAAATDLDLSDDEEDGDDLSNVFGDSKGFAEFVEKIGASSFEQILEASAAYLAGVEGRPHFSRPQLMRHLTEVIPQGTFQREDGLRSFGTLLRDGRIAKVRRGQFMLSEESTYLAEARKLAQ